ncbi:MAG: phage portal protein, partial [Actinomycetia bacterium]|nr:phage portal protein [Actinomycetes bacterium]
MSSVLARALGATPEARSVSFQDMWGRGADMFGVSTAAGVAVNDRSAMTLSAVFGSVRILAEGVSTLPVVADADANMPPWVDQPSAKSPHLSIADIIGQVMVSLLHRGKGFVLTGRQAGAVVDLEVLSPDACQLVHVDVGGLTRTRFRVDGANRLLRPDEIAYVPGLMAPGSIEGMAPLDYARETIALGLAAQTFGAGFFGNGANPSGIIEVAESLSPDE